MSGFPARRGMRRGKSVPNLVFAAAMVLSGGARAAGVDFDGGGSSLKSGFGAVPAAPAVAAAPAASPAPSGETKDWTIMVYINAKNSLAFAGPKDVREMELVGSTPGMNVVVELGFRNPFNFQSKATRFLVNKALVQMPVGITSPVLQDLGAVDMGDWHHLVDFGKWAKTNYPARKYMLIVWNHGSGWEPGKTVFENVPVKAISFDDETHNTITTPELAAALGAIGGVDVYGSDACLMQMLEVAYELKPYAKYIVGSEETEPGGGYDYTKFLGMAAKGNPSPQQLASYAVQAYYAKYNSSKAGATQSYVVPSALDTLIPFLNYWVDAVIAADDFETVANAALAAQRFAVPGNKDLVHFMNLVAQTTKNREVKLKSMQVISVVMNQVVGLSAHIGAKYANAYGLAIYNPSDYIEDGYWQLAFAKASKWDKFLNWVEKKRKAAAL